MMIFLAYFVFFVLVSAFGTLLFWFMRRRLTMTEHVALWTTGIAAALWTDVLRMFT